MPDMSIKLLAREHQFWFNVRYIFQFIYSQSIIKQKVYYKETNIFGTQKTSSNLNLYEVNNQSFNPIN